MRKHVVLLGLFWMIAAPDARTEPSAGDPRLAEAGALLADSSSYDEAAALYRAILADAPSGDVADEARLSLARVLSWQGEHEESLGHYAELTGRPTPVYDAEIEQAEVLSWSGRYDEAEAAFGALLAREPEDARAARGLARVYLWSQRPDLADAAFERALALQEDEEARSELARLRDAKGWEIALESDFETDTDGFSHLQAHSEARFDWGYRTKILARIGSVWIDLDRDDPPAPGLPERADDVALEGWLGIEHRFARATIRLELGGRYWRDSPDHFLARGVVEAPTPTGGVVTALVEHGDFLKRSASFDAVRDGIRDTTLRLATWQPLHEKLSLYMWGEGSFLDDGNQRFAGGLSTDFTPWTGRGLTASLFASQVHYSDRSVLYYDPEIDVSAGLALRVQRDVAEWLAIDLSGRAGLGYTEQEDGGELGFAWGFEGGPSWHPGRGWSVALRGRVSRSQRSSTYGIYGASLLIAKDF